MDDADWDLHAVVRGCCTAASAVDSSSGRDASAVADLFEPKRESASKEELDDLYKPFFPNSSQKIVPSNYLPLDNIVGETREVVPPPLFAVVGSSKASASHKSTPRSKKRKKHMKRVCHVAAENLSSDVWSWRKYGQKPIKGSPFPRGYYKCSTSKGCMARKQVERNRSDPSMFIVTYTGEHNHALPTHRNSLAGVPRHKPSESNDDTKKPMSPKELGTLQDGLENNGDNNDGFTPLDEDFFEGLEDFTGGECLTDNSLATAVELPWQLDDGGTAAGSTLSHNKCTTSGC